MKNNDDYNDYDDSIDVKWFDALNMLIPLYIMIIILRALYILNIIVKTIPILITLIGMSLLWSIDAIHQTIIYILNRICFFLVYNVDPKRVEKDKKDALNEYIKTLKGIKFIPESIGILWKYGL